MRDTKVIAIGGGGFTHATDPDMDLFCLDQAPRAPRVGYIGTASGDDPEKIERFHDRFRGLTAARSHLPAGAEAREAKDWLAGLDLVYVGGGDPDRLIAHWNRTGIAALLAGAAAAGVVMAGVSAGAMCWFKACLYRSETAGLQPLDGIGLVAGSMTPHYLVEPERRAAMANLIARGVLPPGYAVEDGAALVLTGGEPSAVFAAEGKNGVYRITLDAPGTATETVVRAG